MIEDITLYQKVFRKFRDAGFSIWLDDFGSGFSSLNVLQNYRFDVMKFDMLFLRDDSPRGRQLLASLISAAKALGIHTLTEGVETEDQKNFLLSTYELVVLFYLDSKVVKRIYTANDMPVYDREDSIEESLRRFCEAEVEPVDQERYLAFMNLETMTARVEASPKKFIQSVFRMRWEKDHGNWYTARVTQIPTFTEKVHMLTIQNLQGNVNQWLDIVVKEHPEVF